MSTAINVIDRNSEARKILWALLAALLIHLLVAFLLAGFGGRLTSSSEVEDKPPELTIVNVVPTPAPIAPKNAPFMETDASKKAPEPKEKTFESNANSLAASELPASGNVPLPSQEGRTDRPFTGFENQQASLGLETKPVQPPAPSAIPTPEASKPPPSTPTPVPAATPPADQLAMLTATPPPAMERPDEIEATPTPPEALATPAERAPQQPNSAYRALKEQTRIRGSVNSRGVSSVNAVGTPLGRYTKQITDAIGSRWLYYVKKRGDLFFVGTTHVSFTVTREGKITGLRVHSNTSNEAFANVCLQSVEQSNPPPIPAEVYDLLPSEGLSFDDLSFTIFANE